MMSGVDGRPHSLIAWPRNSCAHSAKQPAIVPHLSQMSGGLLHPPLAMRAVLHLHRHGCGSLTCKPARAVDFPGSSVCTHYSSILVGLATDRDGINGRGGPT